MAALNICITGNIASGKTKLSEVLASGIAQSCHIPEPYARNPFLPLYLKDQARWGFTSALRYFWDYAQVYQDHTKANSYRYHFVDAGIWTNRLLYGRYLSGEGVITPDEHALYQTLCDAVEAHFQHPAADAYIFVETPPLNCWERMHRRGWEYQTHAVTQRYIELLDSYLREMKSIVSSQEIRTLEISSIDVDYTSSAGQQTALALVGSFLDSLD